MNLPSAKFFASSVANKWKSNSAKWNSVERPVCNEKIQSVDVELRQFCAFIPMAAIFRRVLDL